jgi:hypothetical protein
MKMISYHDGHPWTHEQPVLQPVAGRGMDQLMLGEEDIRDLRSLKADQLVKWLESIHARFYHVNMRSEEA